ncbi:MAG: alpha/beta hydrolase [Fimbriimonas sp.]
MLLLPLLAITAPAPLTVDTFVTRLRSVRGEAKARALAEDVRAWFGDDLGKGVNPKIHGTQVVFAVEADQPAEVVAADGTFSLRLRRLGKTPLQVGFLNLKDGDGGLWWYLSGEKKIGGGVLEVYSDDPDTKEQPGVAKGELRTMPPFQSRIFAGTTRDWWIHLPSKRDPNQPLAVMVFQDGQWMKNYTPIMFDNLIAKGQMPPTVGVFITPGLFADGRSNRSFEYDTLSDQYAQFLLQEILPEVEKVQKLRKDPEGRAICGMSSGGICAFTAAWEHPEAFGKVLSLIGSFTNIAHGPDNKAGGHNYSAMIRLVDRKPIRVLLQDGSNDLDNAFGNWPLANMQMAKSLEFKQYDYKFVFGKGGHSDRHGRAHMPEMLRWLWR